MLSKKSTAPAPSAVESGKPTNSIDTLVGQKTVFKGDLEFSGGLRVDGHIKGNVIATGDGNSTLVLSELGEIEGNVSVPHVILNGVIRGNVKSNGRVELQTKAQVHGDIHYRAVEMELGATINGNLVCDSGEVGPNSNLKPVESEGLSPPEIEKAS